MVRMKMRKRRRVRSTRSGIRTARVCLRFGSFERGCPRSESQPEVGSQEGRGGERTGSDRWCEGVVPVPGPGSPTPPLSPSKTPPPPRVGGEIGHSSSHSPTGLTVPRASLLSYLTSASSMSDGRESRRSCGRCERAAEAEAEGSVVEGVEAVACRGSRIASSRLSQRVRA